MQRMKPKNNSQSFSPLETRGQPVKSRRFSAGFTFIEMLIVIVMLSVISLAIYASLSNGVKIWQRIYAKQAIEEDMDIFWDRFTHDLKNTVSFLPINFFGEKDTLSFATIVNSRELQKTTVGKVSYAFNQQAGIINRKQADFSRVFEGREPEVTHSLKDIKSLKFQYYYYHNENKEYLWQDEADKDLPLAVRVECEYVDGPNSDTFVRTVSIPIAA